MDASESRGSAFVSAGGGVAASSVIDSTLFVRDPVLAPLLGSEIAAWAELPPTVWAQVFQILIRSGDLQMVRAKNADYLRMSTGAERRSTLFKWYTRWHKRSKSCIGIPRTMQVP